MKWTNALDGSKKPFGYAKKKKRKQTLNKGEGAYKFHNIYDQLILTMPLTKATSPTYKGAVLSRLGCQSDEAARVAVKRHYKNVSNTFTKIFGFDIMNYLII